MLEVRHLVKKYNRIPAVDDVSFCIRPGEILGYVGPNGAGKSTTVKVLTGLIEPTEGEILFQGHNVRADWIGFQRRMGYVPEEPHLYPHLGGREYLQLVGRLRGLPRRVLEPRMDQMLRLFSLWEDRHSPLSSYSKGMRQKILLSGALLHDPDLLILDEGKVVAHDRVERLRDLMQQPSLEGVFAQLTQQEDPSRVVDGILSAM